MTLTKKERRRRELLATVKSGLLRALRTFIQAFVATYYGADLVSNLDPNLLQSAVTAGMAAVVALVMRVLDETSLPTIPKG